MFIILRSFYVHYFSILLCSLFFNDSSCGLDALLMSWAGNPAETPWWIGLIHIGTFLTKVIAFILFFIWVRWTLPRFRYDQLMKLGWIVFFELALINIFITAGIMVLTRSPSN